MKSQKKETPERYKPLNHTDTSRKRALTDNDDQESIPASKRETPEKPDFEKMANEWITSQYAFSDIGMNAYPCNLAYKAGMERIWNDYVASKEVEKGPNQADFKG